MNIVAMQLAINIENLDPLTYQTTLRLKVTCVATNVLIECLVVVI